MKGKGNFYYALPNLGRLRTRIESPSKTLTSEIRSEFQKICVEVLNESSLKIRSKMIEYIKNRQDLKFKTTDHQKQVMNLFSGIFDSCFAVDQAQLNALAGTDDTDEGEEGQEEAQAEAPAGGQAEGTEAQKAKPKSKASAAKPKDEEFD